MRRHGSSSQSIERNVGRIGNVVLLPIRVNGEAQNFSFARKKEIYQKHNLRMIGEVCKENDRTLTHIEQREAKIIAWAKTRWADI